MVKNWVICLGVSCLLLVGCDEDAGKKAAGTGTGQVIMDFTSSESDAKEMQGTCDSSNVCKGTVNPLAMSYNVTKVNLVKCTNAAKEAVRCDDSAAAAIEDVATLYKHTDTSKPGREIGFGRMYATSEHPKTKDDKTIEKALTAVTAPSESTGIRFFTNFIYIQADYSGVFDKTCLEEAVFKICTADETKAASLCGVEGVRRGDVLLRQKGESSFGFITVDEGELIIAESRPDNYAYRFNELDNKKLVPKDLKSSAGHVKFFWDGEGYAPVHSFVKTTFNSDVDINLLISMDPTDLISWTHDTSATDDVQNTYCPIYDGMFSFAGWPSDKEVTVEAHEPE